MEAYRKNERSVQISGDIVDWLASLLGELSWSIIVDHCYHEGIKVEYYEMIRDAIGLVQACVLMYPRGTDFRTLTLNALAHELDRRLYLKMLSTTWGISGNAYIWHRSME